MIYRSATNFLLSAGKPPLPLRASGPGTAKSLLPRFIIKIKNYIATLKNFKIIIKNFRYG